MERWSIKGRVLEYFDDEHVYLYDGIILPSITQALKLKFPNKYKGIPTKVLNDAANRGTEAHRAIERYVKDGTESDMKELRNFKFLQKAYNFEVLASEVPVILFDHDEPLLAGRLDLVLKIGDQIGGGDIKRTSALDKNYLAYQLNLYRTAYRQCYGVEWEFLRGVHLRDDVRKFVKIPINEDLTAEIIELVKGEKE